MKRVLNQLMQLQELCFALTERQATTSKAHLSELEDSVNEMRASLPTDIDTRVGDLLERSPVIVAPLVNHACMACSQSLPTSVDFGIRTEKKIHQCPGCGRFLYVPDAQLRQTGKRAAEPGRAVSGISQFSASSLMIPQLEAKTRDDTIGELVHRMAERGFVKDPQMLIKRALSREAIASTAVERGLAFPHVRGIEGGGLTLALGMKKGGVEFGAPDKHLTRIVFFSVIPTAASAFYLKLISGLIQVFRETEHRRMLLARKSQDDVWGTLVDLTSNTIR